MTQPADRLDQITRPQFGQSLDRRALWSQRPPGTMQRQPGPYFQPPKHVIGDWTFYFARQQDAAANFNIYDDTINIELSIGTGESALVYRELPELPGVGTAIHFQTEVGQANLVWTNPPTLGYLQPTDKIVSWAAPGRPQSCNVKQRITAYAQFPAFPLFPDFVVANSRRIPMFSTSVQLRQMILTLATPFIPTLAIFADIGGNVVDIQVCDPLASGVTTTLTIPTRASLFLMGTIAPNPDNFWEADWTVIA